MKEVYFRSILIADVQSHVAHFQEFTKGLNVVTSEDNHVGKSSLLKSLYHTLGADVDYDQVWDRQSKLYVATICVDDSEYRIVRFMKRFAVFHGNELMMITESITKELTPLLSEIFDFAVYLPHRETQKVEQAPPAFTFMPYYIDQDKGWNGLYDSFASIQQYKKSDRIKSLYYHLSIYTKSTIELMANRDLLKDRLVELGGENERLRIVLSALQEESSNLPSVTSIQDFENSLVTAKAQIESLVEKMGNARNDVQSLETALHQHQHHLQVIREYRKMKGVDIEANYEAKLHTCPNCGYTFDEEIFNLVCANYSSLNEDYMCQQIQILIDSINEKLSNAKERYVSLMSELNSREHSFDLDQDKFDVYVRQRGLADSVRRYEDSLSSNIAESSDISAKIRQIEKELRKLPSREAIEEKYIECVRLNIIELDAWNPAYDGNIHLLKPIKAQGSLENKIILAQFVGLFQTMEYFKSSATRFTFVVDSPRGKEASHASSIEILKMIAQMKMLPQIILATIKYEDFQKEVGTPAKLIRLTEQRHLLNEQTYSENEAYIAELFELIKNARLE